MNQLSSGEFSRLPGYVQEHLHLLYKYLAEVENTLRQLSIEAGQGTIRWEKGFTMRGLIPDRADVIFKVGQQEIEVSPHHDGYLRISGLDGIYIEPCTDGVRIMPKQKNATAILTATEV